MAEKEPRKLTRIKRLLNRPLEMGLELQGGTITAESFMDIMMEFPEMLNHFVNSDYGQLLEQHPDSVRRVAIEELLNRIISEHNLSLAEAKVFRRKALSLAVLPSKWNRFAKQVEPALKDFREKRAALAKGLELFNSLTKLRRQLKGKQVSPELYSPDALEASMSELIELTLWLNEHHGFYPIILGGWAVYAYYPHYGDVQVEVLFPQKQLADDALAGFYLALDYQPGGIFEKWYYRDVYRNFKRLKVFLVAEHLDDPNVLNEDASVELPWRLAFEDNVLWRIGKATMRVPSREVLLLYRVKDLRDKQHDLKHASGYRKLLLREMIEKDKRDIIALVDFARPKVDVIKLRKMLRHYGFTKYFSETLAELNVDLKKDFSL